MNKSAILSPFWEQASKDQKVIDFYPTPYSTILLLKPSSKRKMLSLKTWREKMEGIMQNEIVPIP